MIGLAARFYLPRIDAGGGVLAAPPEAGRPAVAVQPQEGPVEHCRFHRGGHVVILKGRRPSTADGTGKRREERMDRIVEDVMQFCPVKHAS